MTKETTLGNYEYHYELFDNGCTFSGENIYLCAVGDEDTVNLMGSSLKAAIEDYCERTLSTKVKITIKIKEEK